MDLGDFTIELSEELKEFYEIRNFEKVQKIREGIEQIKFRKDLCGDRREIKKEGIEDFIDSFIGYKGIDYDGTCFKIGGKKFCYLTSVDPGVSDYAQISICDYSALC